MKTKVSPKTGVVGSPDLISIEKEATQKLTELRKLLHSQESTLSEKMKKFKEWIATEKDYILEFKGHNGRWPEGVAEEKSKIAYSIASQIWEGPTYLQEPKLCDKNVEYVDKLTAYYNWATRCQKRLEKHSTNNHRIANQKPAETEQKATINVNIAGDVQARNLQIGQGGSIHDQPITDSKSKGHFGTILEIVGVIINFLKSVFWPK